MLTLEALSLCAAAFACFNSTANSLIESTSMAKHSSDILALPEKTENDTQATGFCPQYAMALNLDAFANKSCEFASKNACASSFETALTRIFPSFCSLQAKMRLSSASHCCRRKSHSSSNKCTSSIPRAAHSRVFSSRCPAGKPPQLECQ